MNFRRIADLWSAYYGQKFTRKNVAVMLGLLKKIRKRAEEVFKGVTVQDLDSVNGYEWFEVKTVLTNAIRRIEDGEKVFYRADW